MISLDTHALVWWRSAPHKLSRDAARAIGRARRIYVPDIVCWEIALLAEAGKLKFDRPVTTWLNDALSEPRVVLQPITPEIALTSVRVGRFLQLDPADHIIAATALELRVPLVSRDGEIPRLPTLEVIW